MSHLSDVDIIRVAYSAIVIHSGKEIDVRRNESFIRRKYFPPPTSSLFPNPVLSETKRRYFRDLFNH